MTVVEKSIPILDEFVEIFSENKKLIFDSSAAVMNDKREGAIRVFKEKGLPGRKDEDYKYSQVQTILEKDYKKQFLPKKIDFDVDEIFKCDIPELDTHVLLVVNGYYYEKQQYLHEFDNGIIWGSLAAAARKYPGLVAKYYGKVAREENDSLVALNTALAQDGHFLYLPKDAVLDKPIQVINLLMSNENLMVQHRNLIILEENSQAEVIICDHTLSPHDFLTNAVTEIHVKDNARFHLTKMQNEHNASANLSHNYITQDKDSTSSFNTITLHGGFVRNNVYADILGENAESNAYGLFLTDWSQHVDNNVFMNHAVPNCVSNQLFKGVLDEMSTGAFTGRILVQQDAQKTNAYQTNNNILLTDDARMRTRPQLEIYADDVKCSHGATVGQLDEDAIFYMRSRGISRQESKLLMMYAFADEVISKIQQTALRERVEELVGKRLRGELARCNNCMVNCC